MSTVQMSFKRAVLAIHGADLIVIQDKNSSDRAIATFVGWENEGDEESDFVIGAEGWDDVYITFGQDVIREGNVMKPVGCCVVLQLYKEKK